MVLQDVLDMCRILENSSILLSKQQLLKILLKKIDKTRYRVYTVLTRLAGSEETASTLSQLVREELLSPEQYEKLSKDNDGTLDLPTIARIIKKNEGVNTLAHEHYNTQ